MKKEIMGLINLIDNNIKVEFHDSVLECDPVDEIVYVGKGLSEEDDRMYMNFIKTLSHVAATYNPFLVGLLHEIGHIETYDEDLDEQRDEEYALLKCAFDNDLMSVEKLNFEYFNIPLELNATQWAIDFIENNVELMNELNTIIC